MKKLILLFLLLSSPAWAATYYMRLDGTAVNKTAATSCSAASTAMSVSTHNGETFSAGDTITLCSEGGTITAQLIPPSSGSSGSPITYINNGAFAYADDAIGVYVNTLNYLTFRGGNWSSTNKSQSYAAVFYLTACSNIIFDAMAVTGSGNGIWVTGASSYITIQNSYIYENTHAAVSGWASSGIAIGGSTTNFTISNNRIIDNGKTATVGGNNEGAGVRIEATGDGPGIISSNTITGNGTAEQGAQIEGVTTDNVTVEKNTLSGGVCAEIKNSANTWIIRYNTCVGTASDIFQYGYDTNESTGVKIYNNTIVGTRATGASPDYCVLLGISSPSAGEFWNNLLIHQGTMASSKIVGFNFSRMNDYANDMATFNNKNDYNLVYGADKWAQGVDEDSGPAYYGYTLAQYQAAFANQNQHSLDSNPLLDSSYHIGAASPAKDAGTPILTYAEMVALGLKVYGTVPDMGGSERVQSTDNFPVLLLSMSQTFLAALSTSSAAYVQPASEAKYLTIGGEYVTIGGEKVDIQ
jgi:hypothetical protein